MLRMNIDDLPPDPPISSYEDALEELSIPDNVVNIKEAPKFRTVSNEELPGDKQGTAGDKEEVSAFRLISAGELMRREIKYDWLITGVCEKSKVGMIFGAPGSGKSFIALDMAVCVGAGLDYCGMPTAKGNVVYICGEGLSGLTRRLKALEKKYDASFDDSVFISLQPGELMSSVNVASIAMAIEAVGNVSLVIIDTYHRNMGAGDENSANDFASVLRNIDSHIACLGIAVMFIHHSGHMSTDRSRGSSAIKAALDFEYMAEKKDDSIYLTNPKMKDAPVNPPMAFNFVQKTLGFDDYDEPITSAYLEFTGNHKAITSRHVNVVFFFQNLLSVLLDYIKNTVLIFH